MPDLSDNARRAMPYWGVIERAARDRLGTADLWSAIHDEADRMGYASPGVSAAGVAQLYSRAVAIVRREAELARAADTDVLRAEHIAEAPWARSQAEQNAAPMYQVRWQHIVREDGEERQVWRTSRFRAADLPGTIGELADAIDQDADELGDSYGIASLGVGAIHVLRV